MALKLITFDLDNTLWENDEVIERAEQRCYEHLVSKAPAVHDRFSQNDLQQLRKQLIEASPHLAAQVSKTRKLSLQQALETVKHPAEQIKDLVNECFDCFLQERNRVTLNAHTIPLLETLSATFKLASLTNGNSNLQHIGIAHYFAFSLSAEKVGANKPRPNIFHAALHQASVNPNECLHIGDHPIDDMQGAQQLGIHTLWFNPQRKKWRVTDGNEPSLSVHCLSEIPQRVHDLARHLA